MKLSKSEISRAIYYSLRGIGVLGYWNAAKLLAASFTSRSIKVSPKAYGQSLAIRGNTSDVETFFSIIIRESYPVTTDDVRVIIDAGANVGYSAAFFAHNYPNATVYALEPELKNFELLKANTSKYTNVVPLNFALWSSTGQLFLKDPTAEAWAFQFGSAEVGTQKIDAFSIADLVSKFGLDRIDILKMDVEGAEKEIFSGSTDWLERTGSMYLEFHDRFVKGSAATAFRVLNDFDYEFDVRFEYAIFANIVRRKPSDIAKSIGTSSDAN